MSEERELDFLVPDDLDPKVYWSEFRTPYCKAYKRLPRGKIVEREGGYYRKYFKFLRRVYEPIALEDLEALKEKLEMRQCIKNALSHWDCKYQMNDV